MTAGWCSTTIDAACNVEYGTRVVQKRDGGTAFPVYGGGGVTFFIDASNRENRVVVSRFGMSEECTRFVEGQFFLNDSGLTLSPKDEAALLPAFLDRLILSLNREIFSLGRGAAQKNLDVPAFKTLRISYPNSIAEQRRIVAILDEAFEGIATAKAQIEKNLGNACALLESHLERVFAERGREWMEKRLAELARINYGYTESASLDAVGPHFLRITDIQGSKVDWGAVPYCRIDKSDLTKYELKDGDIVFARTGATTGKSYLVQDPPESVFASYLIRVRIGSEDLLPQFLSWFFHSPFYWRTIRSGVSGSAQGGFNATKLAELVIPFPKSKSEQMAVVAKFEELAERTHRLAHLHERKLGALDELKKSLLYGAFNGQL